MTVALPIDAALVRDVLEYDKREGGGTAAAALSGLFGPQRAFVEDTAKRKAALCSRRAGKTDGTARWLLEGAATSPHGLSLYVALRKANARQQMWAKLATLNRAHRLGLELKEPDGQLMVACPNGHRIWLAGCSDAGELDKFRGDAYRRVAIDEAASYPFLGELIDDVLDPALLDCDGELALIGTPSPIPAGLFHDVTTGGRKGWSVHRWNVTDNPFIPHAAKWLADKRASNNWDEQHPTYRREWLGQWVRDDDALVYPYDAERNGWWEGHDGADGWRYVLALDFGMTDPTAFVELAYRYGAPEIHILSAWKRPGMILSAVAAHVDQMRSKRRYTAIVGDAAGKVYIEEMRQRWGIPITGSEKQGKVAAAELLRGDLRCGNIKVHVKECRALIDEWSVLQFSEDRTEIVETTPDHCADAALYGYRACRTVYKPEREPGPPGSPEALARESAERRDAMIRKLKRNGDARQRRPY